MIDAPLTVAERRMVNRVLAEVTTRTNEDLPPFRRLCIALDNLKVKYVEEAGAFVRVAVTHSLTFKIPILDFVNEYKRLRKDIKFIRRYRRTRFKIHFPYTTYVSYKNFGVQVQRTVRSLKVGCHFLKEVETLGYFLGLADIKKGNFGWYGPRGKEWPVFLDVNVRSNKKLDLRSSKSKKRFWMVVR